MKLWYGIKNNDVRFAENEQVLTGLGINSPQSFEIGSNGKVTGLNFETSNHATSQQGSSAQPQS